MKNKITNFIATLKKLPVMILGLIIGFHPDLKNSLAHAGTLLVANKTSLDVSLIDETKLRSITTIKVGDGPEDTPHEVEVSPDGQLALVSLYGRVEFNFWKFSFDNSKHPGSSLSLIDIEEGRVLQRIDLPKASSPHGIRFLSNTQAIVTTEGIQSLTFVDFADQAHVQITSFPIPGRGAHLVVVDRNKEFAYIANKDSGSVVKFDLIKKQAIAERVIGSHAEGITLSSDESMVLVTDRIKNRISFLDSKSLEILDQIKTENGPVRVALFDHGQSAIITNSVAGTAQQVDLVHHVISPGFKTTHLVNKNTGKIFEGLFGLLHVPITILVRDDDKTAYIANSYAGNITLVDLVSGEVIETFLAGKEPDGMAYSSHTLKTARVNEEVTEFLNEQEALLCVKKIKGKCFDSDGFRRRDVRMAYVVIDANPSMVWDTLLDIDNYYKWNSFMPVVISSLKVGDPLTFEVHLGKHLKSRETVQILSREEESKLCWGKSYLKGQGESQRCKLLHQLSDGRTIYYTTEKFKKWIGTSMMAFFGKKIEKGMQKEANELKEWIESSRNG